MRNLKIFKKSIFFVLFFIFVFSFTKVDAARLDLSPEKSSVKIGDTFKVTILLSSSNESANAVSGGVSFSSDLLTLTSLSKSNSIISLWPVEPTYSNSTGKVSFEGVVLSGYTGSRATILTMSFRAKGAGRAMINFNTGNVLANDGSGSSLTTALGDSSITIAEPAIVEKKVTEVPTPKTTTEKESPEKKKKTIVTLSVEEIKKKDSLDLKSRFLITSTGKKADVPYKIEIDDLSYVWDDLGTSDHVFETEPLSIGIHTIKVYMETAEGNSISKVVSFSNTGIQPPVFTDFSNNIFEGEFIVIKGKSDPATYVKIDYDFISSQYDTKHVSGTVRANEKGLFTYVPEDRSVMGIYNFTAYAYTEDGIQSEKTAPLKISVKSASKPFFQKMMDVLAIIIPVVALLFLLILLIIYSWYKIINHHNKHKKIV